MAYVITQNCCKDASCVPVCPVDCIRPAGGPGEFTDTEMLYIDPEACIDCGACVDVCPVDAIYLEDELPVSLERFRDLNASYFERHPLEPDLRSSHSDHRPIAPGTLRVAIVGSGPAACYAAAELIRIDGVEVDLFERLPTPFGLIRAGVAPDHQLTKSIVEIFAPVFSSPRLGAHFNVEVGNRLTHDDLLAHHHAVIYAVGASTSRDLGIPGEELPGNYAAADFVGWYNGHPDQAGDSFDLSTERAVVVGNGNVALDVARVLLMTDEQLAATDIAEHALVALRDSAIQEVVILGRRGPRDAAFSAGEFLALAHLPEVDVIVDSEELEATSEDGAETALKLKVAREYAAAERRPGRKRIVFRFLTSPVEVVGEDGRVTGLRVMHNHLDSTGALVLGDRAGKTELIETSLILRSIGYTGVPIDGVAFDSVRGVALNDRGRVVDDEGDPIPGVYVTGWVKRGPHGVIGTNRICAQETVGKLWDDFDEGRLSRSIRDRDALEELLKSSGASPVSWQDWQAIDAAERERGTQESRPRVKFTKVDDMIAAARG
ncbi:FAD-dependent oxidoreductase [Mycobacterium sp.]|uniref:FAD-dependent oxidoreductase n=1 Tax=Mycobacterium sp. TaxID=1785 RepID=UPI0025F6170B|nr:FAD-dependent oxidoreductase [Mycobacterium sp.]